MFPRKYKKLSSFKRFILKLLNVYAIDRETLNLVNPNYKNSDKNPPSPAPSPAAIPQVEKLSTFASGKFSLNTLSFFDNKFPIVVFPETIMPIK